MAIAPAGSYDLTVHDAKHTLVPMTSKRKKDAAAVRLGRRGGRARREALTPGRRTEIARAAALARWEKRKES